MLLKTSKWLTLKWSDVVCYLVNFKINIINKQIENWLQLIIYISFVGANSGDYFDITYLYQQLVYWKKIAVQIAISLKTF